jgi:2-isopropylmalate synthase
LTARSGRAALRFRLQKLGVQVNNYDMEMLYAKFIKIADREKEVNVDHLNGMMAEVHAGLLVAA